MQICCSPCSVILNVSTTQYTHSFNSVYHPHWLVQWRCMRIPVHSPWLPGYTNVTQTLFAILTMAGLFLDRPCTYPSPQTLIRSLKKNIYIYIYIIYLFLERGREGEREGEKHQCVVASCVPPTGDLARNPACALTGDWTSDPLVCKLALNPLSHTSQGWEAFLVFGWYRPACTIIFTKSEAGSLRDSFKWVMDRGKKTNPWEEFLMNADIQMNPPSSGGTSLRHFWNSPTEGLSESVCELPPHPSKFHYVKPHLVSWFKFLIQK